MVEPTTMATGSAVARFSYPKEFSQESSSRVSLIVLLSKEVAKSLHMLAQQVFQSMCLFLVYLLKVQG